MENSSRITFLYGRHLDQSLNASERTELTNLLADPAHQRVFERLLDDRWDSLKEDLLLEVPFDLDERVFAHVTAHRSTGGNRKKFVRLWQRIAVAAAILIFFGAGLFFWNHTPKPDLSAAVRANHIEPGKSNQATLTLANGRKIVLSDVISGELARESGAVVSKTAEGQLIYTVNGMGDTTAVNTLSTANGETYQLRLPDGTVVWLNAGSSLTFPVSFRNSTRRRVDLSGEAYFEVAKDKAHPFVVTSASQQVMVLGTHFNINAYKDEPGIKTTLLEGSVKVSRLQGGTAEDAVRSGVVLKPGEQAVLHHAGLSVSAANTEQAVSWKDGYFYFNDEQIESIMRKVAHWYNVEVVYEGKVSTELYNGKISRLKNIDQLLDMLSSTKTLDFEVRGRRVVVRSK